MTFLNEEQLGQLYPVGTELDLRVMHRAADFFIGRWSFALRLKNRIAMVSKQSLAWLEATATAGADGENGLVGTAQEIEAVFRGTGIMPSRQVEPWPTRGDTPIEWHTSGYSGRGVSRGNYDAERHKALLARGSRTPRPRRQKLTPREVRELDEDPVAWYHAYRSDQ